MINSGSRSTRCLKIDCVFVSVRIYKESDFADKRSALSLICCSDSSPVTYKTRVWVKERATCNNKVDFPMPGSPPIKTKEPGTIPPPKTRLNSGSEQVSLGRFSKLTSFNSLGFAADFGLPLVFQTSAG